MMNENKSIQEYRIFKKNILLWSMIVAALVQLISLPIIGWNLSFSKGLVIGTATALITFALHALSCQAIVNRDGGATIIMIISHFGRLILMGIAYYFCAKYDIIYCGFGCIFGLLTEKAAMYIVVVLLPALTRRRKKAKHNAREEE